ncbi:peptidase M48 Ste24p [Ectopseudomonas toyotomiensis]|uniref:Putative Zn-dependent protease n=1 Tax=Ectopseudomonas toyotomiensis TaxID=554344 RepID=A0A1I5PHY9_9GAMM|nr:MULTISPECIES: M48 family metalloprotease [Pseudomonas]PIA73597.1 peptidase M48 Ste24p [Pseudomonas toyotomiensis]SDA49457.1 Putative Zn-dependent protease [Pseudomonas sp. NFPP33]SFP33420.1 Putative Zn-dependent protease [Pseudomonas toyotomiensis]
MIRALTLCFICGWLAGCAVNPATGRTDFVMMSERQELELGARYNQEILKQYPRYEDAKLQAYIQRVGERVARSSHRNQLNYVFTLVDSPDVNAFALPGGYIYIHRGLLAYLNSEAELAAVLGHEVGHVTARHSVRQQSQSTAWGLLGQAAAIGTGVGAVGDLTSAMGNAFVRGYGRDMELEADGLGAQYLARGGYDPQAMIEVVKVLKAQEDFAREQAAKRGEVPAAGGYHGLFDTHPDNDRRLQEVIGPARALVGGNQEVGRDNFLQMLDGLVFGDSAASGIRRGRNFYHGELDFTLTYPQGWQLVNRPDVLIGHTPDEQAFIAMTLEAADKRLSPAEFLRQRVGNQRLMAGEELRLGALQGYTAVLQGQSARRVAVIYRGDNAYLFVAAVKGRASLETEDQRFLEVIRSYRPLKPAERKLAEPVRLHLVRAKAGQSISALAKNSPLPADGEAQLRLLNGLYPSGEPRAGEWLKTLR